MKRVAVIGGGLGGMTAAGELAWAGHQVTLFERGPALGGKAQAITSDGIVLDTGPTLLTLPHVVREGFRRLGAEDLLPRFIELEVQCEYRWADGKRFAAHRTIDETATSAEQAFGEGAAMRAFYDDAAAIHRAAGEPYLEAPLGGAVEYMVRVARRGLGALWKGARLGTLDDLAQKHFRARHLREYVGRFATYAGASPYAASAAFALIPHIERAFGVHHVEGGMGALSAALGVALGRLGVRVRLNAAAAWRAHGSGFVAGPDKEEESFDAVVVNADPMASMGRVEEELALSGYVALLSAERLPSLTHHTVSFAHDYLAEFEALFSGRVAQDVTFYVCHPAASDVSMAPAGRSGLFVMVNAPPLGEGADWQELSERLREQCVKHVGDLGARDVRFVAERTPEDFARAGAPRGSIYGFLPHGRFGPFRRPRMRSRTPGLFFSGGGTHPGGGVPLVMLSGHFAAQLATEHLGGRP